MTTHTTVDETAPYGSLGSKLSGLVLVAVGLAVLTFAAVTHPTVLASSGTAAHALMQEPQLLLLVLGGAAAAMAGVLQILHVPGDDPSQLTSAD